MAVKQIVLRGISRTPSDRMNSDGGVAESLNFQIEEQESAPVAHPIDSMDALHLPDGIDGEILYLHRQNNYANFIVKESSGNVVAYCSNGKVCQFEALKTVNDINSFTHIGNTLVVSADRPYYFYFKKGEYHYLDSDFLFPDLKINPENQANSHTIIATSTKDITRGAWMAFETCWNTGDSEESEIDEDLKQEFKDLKQTLFVDLKAKLKGNTDVFNKTTYPQCFCAPVFVVYAIKLYDDTRIVSMPKLINPEFAYPNIMAVKIDTTFKTIEHDPEQYTAQLVRLGGPVYKLKLQLEGDWDYSSWKDVVQELEIYVSDPVDGSDLIEYEAEDRRQDTFNYYKYPSSMVSYRYDRDQDTPTLERVWDYYLLNVDLKQPINIKTLLSRYSVFRRIQSFVINEADIDITIDNKWKKSFSDNYDSLLEGHIMGDLPIFSDETSDTPLDILRTLPALSDSVYSFYKDNFSAQNISSYNNRLILSGITEYLKAVPYGFLSVSDYKNTPAPGGFLSRSSNNKAEFSFLFLCEGDSQEDMKVYARDTKGNIFFPECETDDDRLWHVGYISYPDDSCYKVRVTCKTEGHIYQKDFDMWSSPTLPMSIGIFSNDLSVSLYDLLAKKENRVHIYHEEEESREVYKLNQLYASSVDSLYTFPISSRFTYTGDVLGVGNISVPLSTGQFGQFAMYVFTTDGVYALGVNETGDFMASTAVSRDVCISSKQILSIEQAIIFATKKGLCAIIGGEVKDLSSTMTGHKYVLSESILGYLERCDFSGLVETLRDDRQFTSFIASCRMTYDYVGKRIILFNSKVDYALVYRLQESTWHTISLPEGASFQNVINSYPDALVAMTMPKNGMIKSRILDFSTVLDAKDTTTETSSVIITRTIDLDNPDVLKTINHLKIRGRYERYYIDSCKYWLIADWKEQYTSPDWKEELEEIVVPGCLSPIGATMTTEQIHSLVYEGRCEVSNDFPFDMFTEMIQNFATMTLEDVLKPRVSYILLGSQDGIHFARLGSLRGKSWKMFRIIILAKLRPHERISWIDIDYETRFTNKLR